MNYILCVFYVSPFHKIYGEFNNLFPIRGVDYVIQLYKRALTKVQGLTLFTQSVMTTRETMMWASIYKLRGNNTLSSVWVLLLFIFADLCKRLRIMNNTSLITHRISINKWIHVNFLTYIYCLSLFNMHFSVYWWVFKKLLCILLFVLLLQYKYMHFPCIYTGSYTEDSFPLSWEASML